jgi:transcriptional regulator with XRE-family HTH domain
MSSVLTRILTTDRDGLAAVRQDLGYSAAEIERATGLTRGVVSAVEAGRTYAYPKFQQSVTAFLAEETGQPFDELHRRLFPDSDTREAA